MTLVWALLVVPAVAAVAALFLPTARAVLALGVLGSLVEAALAVAILPRAVAAPVFAFDDNLFVDALSAWNLMLVVGVFAFASVYAWTYFAHDVREGRFGLHKARRFGAAWFAFLGSMVGVLVSNNVGLMWVAMEATTLASGLLVALEFDRASVRATWTYLVLCSVGIALALLGTFLLCGEGQLVAGPDRSPFLWTDLLAVAPQMRANAVRIAFLFLLVGYGTKAGLAPMHTWLPDAHGQAPTPVSAVLSGVLLNCAIYAVSRFLPITDAATGGDGWAGSILVPFGLASVAVAAVFLVRERDVKRFLAFCSVEHMGIIALGLGLGGVGAALYHTLNHSLAKMVAFFCAGRLARATGTRDLTRMGAVLTLAPLAGSGIVVAFLALVGAPPFATFMSEFGIVRAGIAGGSVPAVVLFLALLAVIAVAMVRQALRLVWQPRPEGAVAGNGGGGVVDWPLIVLPLAALLVLGVWMPDAMRDALGKAAAVVRGVQ